MWTRVRQYLYDVLFGYQVGACQICCVYRDSSFAGIICTSDLDKLGRMLIGLQSCTERGNLIFGRGQTKAIFHGFG